MAFLRFIDDQGVPQTRALGADKFIIGRVEPAQLVVVHDLVSREHARIDRDPDGRYRIRDLGSRNKSFVNGQQITETLLTHGDMVRIGERVLEYVDDTFAEQTFDLSFLTPDRTDPPGTEWVKMKAPVTLPLARLGEIAALGADVGYPARSEDVASAALGRLLQMFGADRGFVALRGATNKELRPVAQRGLSGGPGVARVPVSQTFVMSAFLQSVAGRYPQKAGQIDAKSGFAATGLVAPLYYHSEAVGIVYVDRPNTSQAFAEGALAEIAAAGAQLATLMAEASQRLTSTEPAVGAAWLSTLRRMQLAMTVPPSNSKSFDVAVKLLAGRSRCGDFCDVIHVSDTRMFLVIVDAGGHGVSGLVTAAAIRTAARTAVTVEGGSRDLAAIVTAINRTMSAKRSRQVVTCTFVDVDLSGGQIRYVNAGGPAPMVLVGAGRMVTLDQPALVLGIDTNYLYEAAAVDLPASFRLICHSDGVHEIANSAGEPLGSQKVHDLLLERESFTTPGEIVSRVAATCEKHRGGAPIDDDALIVVVGHG